MSESISEPKMNSCAGSFFGAVAAKSREKFVQA